MGKQRFDVDQQIGELLRTAKTSLKRSATFLTRMDGTTQHLEVVESSIPLLFSEGARGSRRRACARRCATATCPR